MRLFTFELPKRMCERSRSSGDSRILGLVYSGETRILRERYHPPRSITQRQVIFALIYIEIELLDEFRER